MAFYCVHCDLRFEPEGEERPRCPKCMRAKDLKPVEASEPGAPPSRGHTAGPSAAVWLGGLAVAAVLAATGVWLWKGAPEGGKPVAAAPADLEAELEAAGAPAAAMDWLRADAAVEEFATGAVGDASEPEAKARAVYDALRERAHAGAFVPWSLSETRTGKALPPAELVDVVSKDGGRAELYPFELVAFAVSALRSVDVPARAVELVRWPDAKAPLDPSGVLGYFVLGVGDRVFDVYAGRTVPERAERRPLEDTELVAVGLSLQAMHAATGRGDTKEATRLSEAALELAPKSPLARSVRAAVWAASGSLDDAMAEFEAAAQLRNDAARRYNLASVAMLSMEVERASSELNELLAEYPDYALARVPVAALELQRGDVEEASRQLDLAEGVAPGLSAVRWARAELAAARGDNAEAKRLGREAFDARPTLEAHLRLAQLQRHVGDLSGAAETVRSALDRAPGYRKEQLRATLEALVGPAVMLEVDTPEGAGAPDVASAPLDTPDFDLSQGLKLLDDEEASGKPSLTDPDAKAEGPLLLLGDTSKLKLQREGQQKLKLELPE